MNDESIFYMLRALVWMILISFPALLSLLIWHIFNRKSFEESKEDIWNIFFEIYL